MLYEIQTLMVPIVNFTGVWPPKLEDYPPGHFPQGYEALARVPWRGPGCTGIIPTATNEGGTVYHARNLDFSPVDIMTNLVYNGIFTKGGVEIFRSQMVAGYTMVRIRRKKVELYSMEGEASIAIAFYCDCPWQCSFHGSAA